MKFIVTLSFISDGPRQMSIHPIKDTYDTYEDITCSADGNPKPIYIWTNMKTRESKPGQQLSVDLKPGSYAFQCTATNEIGISFKRIISFRVKEDDQGNFTTHDTGNIFI